MLERGKPMNNLHFLDAVRERFAFLGTLGFSEVESLPTLVRYQKRDIEVRVYHGRSSFELGFQLDRDGTSVSLGELIRLTDEEAADGYRNYAATTPERIRTGLALLANLVQKYAERALRGEADVFEKLHRQRQAWGERYAQEVCATHLRPRAEAAFRQGNYRQAAELYEQMRPQLSPVELKKLSLAKRRL
jgi:hypothetical protein